MTRRVLTVQDLTTVLASSTGPVRFLDQVSFHLDAGEVLALVGESGAGKSMTAYTLFGLLEPPLQRVAGRILFHDDDLASWSPARLRQLRGSRMAMIFQDAMMALNPVLSIGTQLIETIRAHQRLSARAARARALEVLQQVGMAAAAERLHAYPHQFSGGMRQRVSIAMALANRPELIICDEPTTALDVTIQAQILAQIQQLCIEAGTALMWITHDLSLVAGLADRVAVMYAGRIVETGTTAEVIEAPRHPYTRGLIDATPAAQRMAQGTARLVPIPGAPPRLSALPAGCSFRPRCAHASTLCEQVPTQHHEGPSRAYRCVHPLGLSAPAA